jgi:hypothetical protein
MKNASNLNRVILVGIRGPEFFESSSRLMDLFEDVEGVPASLKAEASEGLALLEHLRSDFDEVEGLGLFN